MATVTATMDISEETERRMTLDLSEGFKRMVLEELAHGLVSRLLSENFIHFDSERISLPGGSISRMTASLSVELSNSISYEGPELRTHPPTPRRMTSRELYEVYCRTRDALVGGVPSTPSPHSNPTPKRPPCRECGSITYDIYFTSKKGPRAGTTLCGDCFHEKEKKKQVKEEVLVDELPKSSARKALDLVRGRSEK